MLLFIFAIILVHIITSVKRLITFYFIIVILLLFSKKTDSRDDCLSRVCVVFLFASQVQCIEPAAGEGTHESVIRIL